MAQETRLRDEPRPEAAGRVSRTLARGHQLIRGRLIWIVVLLFVIWTAGPLYWSAVASFKTRGDTYNLSALPQNPTLEGYANAVGVDGFERFFFNSVFIATASTIVTVLISAIAAYAVSRFAFRFRNLLLLAILLPRLVPRISLIVPIYQLLVNVNLLNTYTALIVTYAASSVPLGTWILVGFFRGVPREIEDAASVDGANMWQRLTKVVFPLALPGLITVGVLAFRDAWNEFPFVLAFTTDASMRTFPYALFLLNDTLGVQQWNTINAFALLTILPVLIIYLAFEKRVVSGLTSGAVK